MIFLYFHFFRTRKSAYLILRRTTYIAKILNFFALWLVQKFKNLFHCWTLCRVYAGTSNNQFPELITWYLGNLVRARTNFWTLARGHFQQNFSKTVDVHHWRLLISSPCLKGSVLQGSPIWCHELAQDFCCAVVTHLCYPTGVPIFL